MHAIAGGRFCSLARNSLPVAPLFFRRPHLANCYFPSYISSVRERGNPPNQIFAFLKNMPSIRDEVSFEKRTAEAHRIRAKYPNRIPVICEKAPRSDLPVIDKKKFLVPMNMLVGEFKYIIHKHINQCAQNSGLPLTHEKTIYLFVENTAPKAGALMQEVYEQHVSDDGFLYVEYSSENTLG